MRIVVTLNERGTPRGLLADVELHFEDGPLVGNKLCGFGVWEGATAQGPRVSMPSRTYTVRGEQRSYQLFRPITSNLPGQLLIVEQILAAYHEKAAAAERVRPAAEVRS